MTVQPFRHFAAYASWRFVAATGVAIVLTTGACSENRPFERETNGAQAKLAVPSSITPPISVQGIDGAPGEWKLAERVADALRSRDIPASSTSRRSKAYVLKGEMRQGTVRNGRSRVEVVWSLYDGVGRKVGEVTQMAAVPGAVFKAPNDGVIDAMADAAAESIAPLVPSSSLQLADGLETGERKPNERARIEDRDRVTAVGKMPARSGVAKNLLDPPKPPANAARADIASTRRAAPPASTEARGDKKAVTAVGRYQGTSALSRNLFRTDVDPSKPLPRPKMPTPRATEAEESLGAHPVPADDRRRDAARKSAEAIRQPQRAEADIAKTDIVPGTGRQQAESTQPPPRTAAVPRGSYEHWVQLGSHRDEATSRAEWEKIQRAAGAILASAGNRIQRADLGSRGVYYRIQVGPFASAGEATRLCAQLKAQRIDCFLPPAERADPGDTRPKAAAPKAAPKVAAPKAKPPAKPNDTAAVPPKAPEKAPAKPGSAKAEKPDAPISTAPGLPGVLD
ncbi:MAG: SPOR domain-containing protein [Rhodospirillaceae bacterium]|nr:SPOR domain-containing protein [Rhodospirillaceae bacterium]